MAKTLITLGAALLICGVLLYLFPNLFAWFGRLPGDIRIESGRGRVSVPITSMIILSVALSLVLTLLRR